MNVFAHRGCAEQYPENTVSAFERAAPQVDAVELDVRQCGSGEIVVFHDERLDRLTDESGLVDETPLDRLQSLQVAGADETIPTLCACLAVIPDDTLVNVELKETGIATAVHRACADAGNDIIVSSFESEALAEYHAVAPETPIAVIEQADVAAAFAAAERLDADALHPSLPLAAATDLLTRGSDLLATGKSLVHRAHERGLAVNVWTLADESAVSRARELGVDGVIVDRWDII